MKREVENLSKELASARRLRDEHYRMADRLLEADPVRAENIERIARLWEEKALRIAQGLSTQ